MHVCSLIGGNIIQYLDNYECWYAIQIFCTPSKLVDSHKILINSKFGFFLLQLCDSESNFFKIHNREVR